MNKGKVKMIFFYSLFLQESRLIRIAHFENFTKLLQASKFLLIKEEAEDMNCIVENMLNNISTQTIKSIQNDYNNKELADFFNDKNPRERAIIEDSKNDPIARRMDPKTQQDIKLLSSELKMWQKNQFEEIEQMRDISVEERIKLRSDVLSKETFLLRKIESMRQGIRFTNEQSDLDEKLNELSKPHRWILSNGEEIEVMTSSRKHCCDLVRMYQEYSNDFDQSGKQVLY